MKTFKVLGLLMSYPKPEWVSHLEECRLLLEQEKFLPKKHLKAVTAFIEMLKIADIYTVQEEYVATFDRGWSHSLHLFEHIYGESRDRGQAMVNLSDAYKEKGFFIDQAELPDYIPLFLEFLSLCPVDEAVALLGEPIDIMATIAARLQERDSSWAALFAALVTFQGDAAGFIVGEAWVFKIHIFLGLTIFLIFPFTRLVHIWSVPIQYLTRSGYQIVRKRG